MKIVSFEVSKALKEAGYPQEFPLNFYVIKAPYKDYNKVGKLLRYSVDYVPIEYRVNAPTYLEVWLWLWREKNIQIDIDYAGYNTAAISSMLVKGEEFPDVFEKKDPEEAIESAITYLVERNLIK